jgi:hypothetical protein
MPTKRRRIARHRVRHAPWRLTDNQRDHLQFGHDYFGDGKPFADDDERRAAWFRHRATIMDDNDRHDRRPAAFWDYEGGWPEGAEGEAHAVRLLPDTPPEHRARIEQDWLRRVEVALLHRRDAAAARDGAASAHGVPAWFFARHAPGIKARLDAASRAWRASIGRA